MAARASLVSPHSPVVLFGSLLLVRPATHDWAGWGTRGMDEGVRGVPLGG